MYIEAFSVVMIIGTCMHVLQLAPNLHDTFSFSILRSAL